MKTWTKSILTGSGSLIAALMISNILNLFFNVFVGRVANLEDYGLVTIINTLWYFISIFIWALSSTIIQRIAYLTTKHNKNAANYFFQVTRNRSIIVVSVITCFYLVCSPFLQLFFHLSGVTILFLLAPSLVAGTLLSLNTGYLHANFMFKLVAVLTLTEAVSKLVFAIIFINLGLGDQIYLAIPLSVLTACIASIYLFKKQKGEVEGKHVYHFPKKFYFASLLAGLSANAFLVYDIALAKHYLSADIAGEYALLSLVGKIIYFIASLINTFMLVFITRDIASKRDPNKTFNVLMLGVILLVGSATTFLILFGGYFAPIVFGQKAVNIIPFIPQYSLTIAAFTLANTIVSYHLARKHYIFPFVAISISIAMIIGIHEYHQNIGEIINVMYKTGILSLVIMTILHLVQRNGGFFFSNLVDLVTVVLPLPKNQPGKITGKRILIYNWRDIKHKYAGGAEVFIHELSKRWVKEGNSVTLFCGNDGTCPRNEVIDGVNIIRRGGFYMVYVWGFLYYLLKFKGRYDIILDSENGLPFFTPFYAKEKKFLIIHHVHQEVFRKSLNPILAWVATFLEIKLMPIAYHNIQVITVSNSSKDAIMHYGLTTQEPHIIYCGIDLKKYKPGIKSVDPLVVYMGRLKQYKSIDVFISSAEKIIKKLPKTKFIIAGNGEEKDNLVAFTKSLGLESAITFLGQITEEAKIKLLQQAWVAVNPSFMEGWGITVIEANACGTPVVAANVPGLKDSVRNPHTGYLVKHGDVDAFADKTLNLLNDSKKRNSFSKQSVKWAKNFDWKKSADKSLELFT